MSYEFDVATAVTEESSDTYCGEIHESRVNTPAVANRSQRGFVSQMAGRTTRSA